MAGRGQREIGISEFSASGILSHRGKQGWNDASAPCGAKVGDDDLVPQRPVRRRRRHSRPCCGRDNRASTQDGVDSESASRQVALHVVALMHPSSSHIKGCYRGFKCANSIDHACQLAVLSHTLLQLASSAFSAWRCVHLSTLTVCLLTVQVGTLAHECEMQRSKHERTQADRLLQL